MPPEIVEGCIVEGCLKKDKISQVKNFNPEFAACPVFQFPFKKTLEFRTVKT